MTTLNSALEGQFRNSPRAAAVVWNDAPIAFAELDDRSAALAATLREAGVTPGDRVAVALPNSPALVAAVLAVLRSGAILVPINPAAPVADAIYATEHSGSALALLGEKQARDWADLTVPTHVPTAAGPASAPTGTPLSERDWFAAKPTDPAMLIYTSGTTGRPKGVVLSHRALAGNLATVARQWRWTRDDRLLLTLPCFHLHGLALGILGSLLVGSTIVLRPRFVATDVPRLLEAHRCTLFFGVPTMYNRLVQLSEEKLEADLGTMRLWVSGSAPLTPATFEQFRRRFGHEILERYGMSEGGFMIATPFEGPRRPGVVGYPLPGIDVRIVEPRAETHGTTGPTSGDVVQVSDGDVIRVSDGDVGEIAIRGANLFSGYWRDRAATERAFTGPYFRSGDLALREGDGMIRIVGRLSVDIIKCRGFKVSAIEIENCLQNHADVDEVAVVGVPHADLGEEIVAVVTPRDGAAGDIARRILEHAESHLARHKVPARIALMAEIPRTGPGKFKKRDLIECLSGVAIERAPA